ncbi:MAG: hypothetical protein K5850_04190 [Bacteroidales bacterium]|nr:hypothetical protein [Bacteroidales bacterium]
MKELNERLNILKKKVIEGDTVTIAIFGLGSVGCFLLDYLVSLSDPQLHIVVVGRNEEKMTKDVNIIRTAATIRKQLRSIITIIGDCDFEDVESIAKVLRNVKPDFIVNSSRLYAGLKYGSISWSNLRAYGIWAPLALQLGKNIMEAYEETRCEAITINTSYSDAVIPWLKSAGKAYFDFGSGNLNHLIPRMKFYVADKFGIENLNEIDITLVASHFHDVVISKEGHTEGMDLLLSVKYHGKELPINKVELFRSCAIPMPTDQKRNMMNASSNFEIITSILNAIRNKQRIKIHSPGVNGFIGGFPYVIDGTGSEIKSYFANNFSLNKMIETNRESIALDGIEDVSDGNLVYTDKLIKDVYNRFHVLLPKTVHLEDSEMVASLLIDSIIILKS